MMKTIRFDLCGLAVVLFIALSMVSTAQNDDAAQREATKKAREAQRAAMRSPATRQAMREGIKRSMRSTWNDEGSNNTVIGMLRLDYFREGLGVSKEISQKIQESFQNVGTAIQDDPNIKPLFEQMGKLHAETPGGFYSENASEETKKKYFDIQMKVQDAIMKRINNIVNENLTPEQLRKIKEYQISTMAQIPFTSPGMFEALDLSDEQRKHLNEIKKELAPEYEKNMDRMAEIQADHQERFQEELGDKLDDVTDPDERNRIMAEVSKKLQESMPDFHKEFISTVWISH